MNLTFVDQIYKNWRIVLFFFRILKRSNLVVWCFMSFDIQKNGWRDLPVEPWSQKYWGIYYMSSPNVSTLSWLCWKEIKLRRKRSKFPVDVSINHWSDITKLFTRYLKSCILCLMFVTTRKQLRWLQNLILFIWSVPFWL